MLWIYGHLLPGFVGSNPAGGVVSVVCCQVEVCASGRSRAQRSSTECGVSECDHDVPQGEAVTRNQVEAPEEKKCLWLGSWCSKGETLHNTSDLFLPLTCDFSIWFSH